LLHAKAIIEKELNASTDNPLIFGKDVLSGGNFHGEPLGLQSDALKANICSLIGISERRSAKLTTAETSNGLPSMLVPEECQSGLNSGLMIPPYSAASLTLRCQTLASPDTIRSLPTSGNQEDYNSNAWNSALFLKDIIGHAFHIISIEIFCATRGITIRLQRAEQLKALQILGKGNEKFYTNVMQYAPYVTQDYFMMDDIDKVSKYLATSEFHQLYNDCTTEHKQVLNLQPPSGTRDFHPWQMDIRDKLMTTIRRIFKNHGGQEIDTPVFERRSTLIGQYGDNDKLIYELMDQGGVELALRYDLTVPM
jgi:hypothetical protein